ncbi:hypothetical protein [Olivibacter sitiensis]|uniref:hypothetical protein n=1 Tax=Olivibacter sitiensis TaxID=376470 RepID=UPI00047FF472|nr:hypothetical protein [Olivibacter sitiensis]
MKRELTHRNGTTWRNIVVLLCAFAFLFVNLSIFHHRHTDQHYASSEKGFHKTVSLDAKCTICDMLSNWQPSKQHHPASIDLAAKQIDLKAIYSKRYFASAIKPLLHALVNKGPPTLFLF